ncbi:MAG: glycoside hydrolase family 9 protein [Uliginosibacterium sp.]|nr:glycoside hydrolase family 9 protein [Uliginosibacterium sp.]
MGLMSVIVNGRNEDFVAKVKAATSRNISQPLVSMKEMLSESEAKMTESPFGVPHSYSDPFNWASNADIANTGGMFAFASKFATGPSYNGRNARRVASYLFGHNPLGKSYVTGYGSNPVRNPHHRLWAKHAEIAFPSAPPGMLVGGPNGKWEGSALSAKVNGREMGNPPCRQREITCS